MYLEKRRDETLEIAFPQNFQRSGRRSNDAFPEEFSATLAILEAHAHAHIVDVRTAEIIATIPGRRALLCNEDVGLLKIGGGCSSIRGPDLLLEHVRLGGNSVTLGAVVDEHDSRLPRCHAGGTLRIWNMSSELAMSVDERAQLHAQNKGTVV